jgi:hypothetical protein
MTKIIRPLDVPAPEQQLSVARVMDQALAPFRLEEELRDAMARTRAHAHLRHDERPARWPLGR